MNEFINQFFDVGFMVDHFDEVLEGFWITLQIFIFAGILALIWGLVLALLRQLPGRALKPVRFLTIAYIDVFRGDPAAALDRPDRRQPRSCSFPNGCACPSGWANPTPSGSAISP